MTVFSNNGADLVLDWKRIACAVLGTMVCLGATDALAGGRDENRTADHTERFAFTGVYRFAFPPASSPSHSARLMAHPLMGVASRTASKTSPQPPFHSRPERSTHVAASNEELITDKAKTAAALHVAIIDTPARKDRSVSASNRIETTTIKQSVSRQGRASLGGPTPGLSATTTPGTKTEDHVHGASALSQDRPMRTAIVAQSLHADRPPVHIALSKPRNSANTESATDDLVATKSLAGRIIDVPPLPELYQRPASQSRLRSKQRTYRSRRATRRKSVSKTAKSVHAKPKSTNGSLAPWMKTVLFELN